MNKTPFFLLLPVFCLAVACSRPQVPSATPAPTFTANPATSTHTPTSTPIPLPTAIGGGSLKVAFVGAGDCPNESRSCLVVGDFFSGQVEIQVPLQGMDNVFLSWSPEGTSILYTDESNGMLKIAVLDVKSHEPMVLGHHSLTASTVVETTSPTSWSTSTISVKNYLLYAYWSDDGKFVFYQTLYSWINKVAYIASVADGEETRLEGISSATTWLPGTHTLVNFGKKAAINIDSGKIDEINSRDLPNATVSNGMLLFSSGEVPSQSKQLIMAYLPANLHDLADWDLDSILSRQVLLAKISPELEDGLFNPSPKVIILGDKVLISGSLSYNTYKNHGNFTVLADLSSLPITISSVDLNNEIFLMTSPDGTWYMTISNVFPVSEPQPTCRLHVRDLHSQQEIVPENDLSQFTGLNQNVCVTSRNTTFYWEP